MSKILFYLYSFFFYCAFPFIFLRLWWKGRKSPRYRQRWKQRLGYSPIFPQGCIWIHAVSLGEMVAIGPLLIKLTKHFPDKTFLLTATTASGSELAEKYVKDNRFNSNVHHTYTPYDTPDVITRFLNRARPEIAIIMETELWPNLLRYTAKRKIPILLATACLSERSAKRYQWIRQFMGGLLNRISIIGAQSQEDASRFIALGAKPEQIKMIGNLKFDFTLPLDLIKKGQEMRLSWGKTRPIFIAASTHPGEEEKILAAFSEIKKHNPDVLLILVPRHLEHFDTVYQLCKKLGNSVVRRTENQPCTHDTQIFLGDTMGELMLYYAMADVAFVGGSFTPIGGHNLIEAAALGLPIITGPFIDNIKETFELLNAVDAAIKVHDEKEFAETCLSLLNDEKRRHRINTAAKHAIQKNQGALEKHFQCILQLLAN